MSVHVLLNKRDKMRGMPSLLSVFHYEFNKFNNSRARVLDSIYHMTLRILLKSHFLRKDIIIALFCTQRCDERHNVSR